MEDFVPPPITVASEPTFIDGLGDSVEPQVTLILESQRKESTTTEWTDEKHSLYLKSMEASFVDQLYSSSDFLSCHAQKDCSSDSISSRKMNSARIPSGQFKVIQGGCWSKIDFGRDKSQLNKGDRSHVFPANPWIQHFRTGWRHQTVASPSLRKRPASTTTSLQFPVSHTNFCCQVSVAGNSEVTGQNFVDEDVAREEASRPYRAKRMRTSVVASSSNDQVVPFGCFTVSEIAENYVSPKK